MLRIVFVALSCIIIERGSEAYVPVMQRSPATFGTRSQCVRRFSALQMAALPMEEAATLLHNLGPIASDVHSMLSSTLTTAAAAAATADMLPTADSLPAESYLPPDVHSIEELDFDKLPEEFLEEWDEYTRQMHEAFSYMDIMRKVPVAAGILAVCDFAVNRLMVDDIEENLRQEEMDGDYDAQNAYFLKGLGIRFGALVVVSVATVLISKWTFDNPY